MKKVLCILATLTMVLSFLATRVNALPSTILQDNPQIIENGTYRSVFSVWMEEEFSDNQDVHLIFQPLDWDNGVVQGNVESFGKSSSILLEQSVSISLQISVPSTGLYRFQIDYYSLSDTFQDLEISLTVNDVLLYQEASQITLAKAWAQTNKQFPKDRFGNDFFGNQEQLSMWLTSPLRDPMGLYVEPLAFYLEQGVNTIEITNKKGNFLIGEFHVFGIQTLLPYSTYALNNSLTSESVLIEVQAQTPDIKSASTIQPGVSRDLSVSPYHIRDLLLNTLSGSTYQTIRQEVTYFVDVSTSGYYHLSIHLLQNMKTNGVVYRTLRINGTIPFEEASSLPIEFSNEWQNYTPSDAFLQPYLFYLEAGRNSISLAVDLSPYRDMVYGIQDALRYVNDTALDIRKLTGNQLDKDRDWDLLDYLPSIDQDLLGIAALLRSFFIQLDAMSLTTKLSEMQSQLRVAIRNLEFLAKEPNQIPKNIALLTTSSSSIAQTLGVIMSDLLTSPVTMDRIYIHANASLPSANASFFQTIWVNIQRFFMSFFDQRYNTVADASELQVWVNRPKLYVDLIQKMVDEEFTPQTGIPVKISVLADEGKLILANSAKRNPDVALGISSWLPYDLGIRGALSELTQFQSQPNFQSTLQNYPAQSLIPMVYNNELYGLPDTENFYILFYRHDILSKLNISVPNTWSDVIKLMPVLRRFGMNFNLPLSSATALKSFDSTLPFFFQYGSKVYADNAFNVDLNNAQSIAALTTMTELYTIYSLDTTVTNFYNDFRLGTSPIGVGDFGMYIRLLNAAPDIQGLWSIALMPGVEQTNGSISRDAPGAQTANVIFKNTTKAEESWKFISWWGSTPTQIAFSSYLLSTLGSEYLWNSANIHAFSQSGYNEADLAVILEQWTHLREIPKVPGSYQVELEISNIWNSVVLNRENLRVRLNDAIIKMEKEIHKKMAEFGYMDKQGNIVKPYQIADISLILSWQGVGEVDE